MVDKTVISSYSGKIKKLFGKSKDVTRHLKLIFHDFPGGPSNFELITRFCYNKGKTKINPLNISNLTCAAHFMEMNNFFAKTENLCEQTAKSIQEIKYWTWAELLASLKQCQNLLPSPISSVILDKFLDSLVTRIALSYETSPCPSTSSPDSSGFRFSCETRSSESMKTILYRPTWWFDDLAALDVRVVEKMVQMMVSRNFDNWIISKFLFYYQKSRFGLASPDERIVIVTGVVEMLFALDVKCVSYKSLFELLRVGLNMNLSQRCKNKLDRMIGSLLDQATLDNLLIPSLAQKSYLYDVNLVVRFLRSFFAKGVSCVPLSRLKKVESLMDLYLAEIAPDPHLKPSKFLAVIGALPNSARDSCDGVYHAMNLYLEVHSALSEERKMKICSGLNYEKLSTETFNHLIQNTNFPPKYATQALMSRQRKLKSLIQDTDLAGRLSLSSETAVKGTRKCEGSRDIVLYAQKLNHWDDENENLKAHLQGMQWRVLELEKVCRKMQFEMAKMTKSRLSSHNNATSLPKLCS
ncbi:BTB/POZ domain-containing protein at3g22104 [Phtheirospermum japonicum]|uniref:BTB/POZ domain-containing protein at3g22104 n=1 Tax=Phtheirospermum japonicum TaxID=374723 RepID=A0A830C2B3_9LAMI|nr:BTB/POZ domain-containing protein at3g22104 [Phtheirospermum japonicum]